MNVSTSAMLLLAGFTAVVGLSLNTNSAGARNVLADPPTMRATVNLTIGSPTEERPEYEFGAISGLTFDAKGQIYVADAEENTVRVYSEKGMHLFSMGRKGSGPSDFLSPLNIAIAKDGLLWVQDAGNNRFNIVTAVPPSGQFVRVLAYSNTMSRTEAVHWDAAGHVVVTSLTPNNKPGDAPRSRRSFVDTKGVVIATVVSPVISPDSSESWTVTTNGNSSTFTKPFGMHRVEAFGGAGLGAFATNSKYAVQLVDSKGKNIALLKRTLASIPLSSNDQATVRASRERVAKMTSVPSANLELDMPKTKPIIAALGFDLDGRLWVARNVQDGLPNEADVYSASGTWVAVMQWPSDVQLAYFAVRGNTGLGVRTDRNDIARVVRLTWK